MGICGALEQPKEIKLVGWGDMGWVLPQPFCGGVAEWFKAAVLKTAISERVS